MTKKTVQTTLKIAAPVALFAILGALALRLMTADSSILLRRQPVRRVKLNPVSFASKRAFDVIASTLGLIAVSPLMLGIAIVIKITSPGPIFYRARRVGRYGKLFGIYKFRTMVVNADKIGPGVTVSHDPRITPIGNLLRRTKLDELPQLLNVLNGEMSLVGPRPEDPRYVAMYSPEQRAVLNVCPGITSSASLHYHDEQSLLTGADWETMYINEIMPAKLAIDLEYAKHPSFQRDIALITDTIVALYNSRVRHAA